MLFFHIVQIKKLKKVISKLPLDIPNTCFIYLFILSPIRDFGLIMFPAGCHNLGWGSCSLFSMVHFHQTPGVCTFVELLTVWWGVSMSFQLSSSSPSHWLDLCLGRFVYTMLDWVVHNSCATMQHPWSLLQQSSPTSSYSAAGGETGWWKFDIKADSGCCVSVSFLPLTQSSWQIFNFPASVDSESLRNFLLQVFDQ